MHKILFNFSMIKTGIIQILLYLNIILRCQILICHWLIYLLNPILTCSIEKVIVMTLILYWPIIFISQVRHTAIFMVCPFKLFMKLWSFLRRFNIKICIFCLLFLVKYWLGSNTWLLLGQLICRLNINQLINLLSRCSLNIWKREIVFIQVQGTIQFQVW